MVENLFYTLLFTLLVLYAIILTFDFYEARKNKDKFGSSFCLLYLFAVLFFIINCPIFSWSIFNFI